jgi:rod shape-determining protein MreC
VLLISVTLMTLNFRGGSRFSFVSVKADMRNVIAPLRSALDAVVRPVSDVVSGAFNYSSLQTQDARLRQELHALESRSVQGKTATQELRTILALNKIPFVGSIPGVNAQVISLTPTNVQLSFEIDKGSSSGIRLNDPVVDASGLAGRVTAVASQTSTVLMLTDPSFAVGVRLGPSGKAALATGEGEGSPLKVSLVTPGTRFTRNQVLTTSGLQGEIFPPGIPVGRVVSASDQPGSLQESVAMQPVVNYGALQFVKVLLWSPPGS